MSTSTRLRMLWALIVVSLAPLPFIVVTPSWSVAGSVWLYVSALTGYAGMVFLLWMYILGSKAVIGLYFADLAAVLRLHKALGKYGTVLVFLHPVAVGLSYGVNLLVYSLVPSLSTDFEQTVTWGRLALYCLVIIWITSALLRGRMPFRPWKYVHYLAYAALPLVLLHAVVGSSYAGRPAVHAYYLAVLSLTALFSLLRLRHLFGLARTKYEVLRHEQVTDDVWLLELKALGRLLSVRRGQYIYLQTSLLGEEHPFSVLQRSVTAGTITVAYKTSGSWTRKLSAVKPGQLMYADGPYGTFTRGLSGTKVTTEPVVFVAGGIGITPFLEELLETGNRQERWLFYANHTNGSAAFAPQLRGALGRRYVSVLSREPSPGGRGDERGRLSVELVRRYLSHPGRYRYYVCGSAGFMEHARQVLHDADVPSERIESEAFGR